MINGKFFKTLIIYKDNFNMISHYDILNTMPQLSDDELFNDAVSTFFCRTLENKDIAQKYYDAVKDASHVRFVTKNMKLDWQQERTLLDVDSILADIAIEKYNHDLDLELANLVVDF